MKWKQNIIVKNFSYKTKNKITKNPQKKALKIKTKCEKNNVKEKQKESLNINEILSRSLCF